MRWLLALALLLAASYASPSHAYALGCSEGGAGQLLCDLQQNAYSACQAEKPSGGTCTVYSHYYVCTAANGYTCNHSGSGPNPSQHFSFYWSQACPADSPWNEGLHRCFNPEECLQRNANPGFGVETVRSWTSKCIDGCMLQMSNYECTSVGGVGSGNKICSGSLNFSGTTCAADPADPDPEAEPKDPPPKQDCMAAGSGQTFCKKPNGDECYTASTGKQICWSPGETGEKTDGPIKQKRDAGESPIPPNLTLDNGDTLTQTGQPVTTTTTTTNSRTITTTTTNYQTTQGTDANGGKAGSHDSGEKNDGSDTKGDGKGSQAGDSGNCDVAPMCEGDAIACLQARYQWKIQCNTGPSDITKGTGCEAGDVPICAGKNCKAEAYASLLQQWRSRCAAKEQLDKVTGDAEAGLTDGESDDEQSAIDALWARDGEGETPQLNTGLLSIGGGDVIPAVELFGTTWTMPSQFYDLGAMIRQIVIAACMVVGFFIAVRRTF